MKKKVLTKGIIATLLLSNLQTQTIVNFDYAKISNLESNLEKENKFKYINTVYAQDINTSSNNTDLIISEATGNYNLDLPIMLKSNLDDKYYYLTPNNYYIDLSSFSGKDADFPRDGEGYYKAEDFSNNSGVAWVQQEENSQISLINTKGKEIFKLEPDQKYISNFSEESVDNKNKEESSAWIQNQDNTLSLINQKNQEIFSANYIDAVTFKDGLSWVKQGEKWGVIDINNNIMISLLYDTAGEFSEDLAWTSKDNKYGAIDKKGQEVIPFIYDDARKFSEGLSWVKQDNVWGAIDNTGSEVIPFKYNNNMDALNAPSIFSEGLSAVKIGGAWGYIDKLGNIVIEPQFDTALEFSNGQAYVTKNNTGYLIQPPFTYDLNLNVKEYSKFSSMQEYLDYLDLKLSEFTTEELLCTSAENLEIINNYIISALNNHSESVNIEVDKNNIYIQDDNFIDTLDEYNNIANQINNIYETIYSNPSNELSHKIALLQKGLIKPLQDGTIFEDDNLLSYNIIQKPAIEFNKDEITNFSDSSEFYDYLKEQLDSVPSISTDDSDQDIAQDQNGEMLDEDTTDSNNIDNENNVDANVDNGVLGEGTTPELDLNQGDIEEIENYLNSMNDNMPIERFEIINNLISFDDEKIQNLLGEMSGFYNDILTLISDYGINLNKQHEHTLNIALTNINLEDTINFIISKDMIETFENHSYIRLVLDERGTNIVLDVQNIIEILEYSEDGSKIEFSITYEEDGVIFSSNNEKLGVYLTLPFGDKNSIPNPEDITIIANINGEFINWGGQVNASSNTIEFLATSSGGYMIQIEETIVNDIEHLTEQQQSIVKFMISKEFFNTIDDNFYPNSTVTRYDFIASLVKVFFVQDNTLTTNFDDIDITNEYYNLVAASEYANITKGYEDNTFRGDNLITRETIISFVGRVLGEQLGYTYPENVADTLDIFKDSQNIASWAKNDIALALSHGLTKINDNFYPKEEITRLEALEVIYDLFELLYEVPSDDVFVNIAGTFKNDNDLNKDLLIGMGIGALLMGIGVSIGKKKNK